MPTKILVYAIIFDIMIAVLSGAYAHVQPPAIGYPPSYSQIEQKISNFTITTPAVPITPQFSLGPLGTIPALTIPSIAIPISLPPILAQVIAGIIWFILYIVYFLTLLFGTILWLITIMASVTSLMYTIPVIGPVLLTIFFVINFIIVWEILKLIRGYGGF